MLSKCFNPSCSATFRYLRLGRLYRIDFSEVRRKCALAGVDGTASHRSKGDSVEHFWLCESCAAALTIAIGAGGEVRLAAHPEPPQLCDQSIPRKPAAADERSADLLASAS